MGKFEEEENAKRFAAKWYLVPELILSDQAQGNGRKAKK